MTRSSCLTCLVTSGTSFVALLVGSGAIGPAWARKRTRSSFTLRRHKTEGYVADFVCGGTTFEPEALAPPFAEKDWIAGRLPADGDIITHASYDELKKLRLAAG